jgi:hypothetical protein
MPGQNGPLLFWQDSADQLFFHTLIDDFRKKTYQNDHFLYLAEVISRRDAAVSGRSLQEDLHFPVHDD